MSNNQRKDGIRGADGKQYLFAADLLVRAREVLLRMKEAFPDRIFEVDPLKVWAVPNGGVPASYILAIGAMGGGDYPPVEIVAHPKVCDVILDDIIDSGATRTRLQAELGKPFFALVDKTGADRHLPWVVFPWELNKEGDIVDNFRRVLQWIGEDPTRDGLVDTPKRMAKAWQQWTSGYRRDLTQEITVFPNEGNDEMVIMRDIPFYSHCEHHMAPFFGTVSIAYIPNEFIIGLSKLVRVVEVFSRRLQVQERLTTDILEALSEFLDPLGAAVVVKARHMCMESRGVCSRGQETITSAVSSALKNKPEARAEFLKLIG